MNKRMQDSHINIRKLSGVNNMNKFNVDDTVVAVDCGMRSRTGLVLGDKYLVTAAHSDNTVQLCGHSGEWYIEDRFELVPPQQQLRDELQAAIELVQSCGVGVKVHSGEVYLSGASDMSVSNMLDILLPLTPPLTAEQKEIEEVEGKLRVLADQLAALKAK